MSRLLGILAVIILLFTMPTFAADMPQFSLGLGIDYVKGDFNTDFTSTCTTFPLIFDWIPNERLNLELNVPFVKLSSGKTSNMATGSMASGSMAVSTGATDNAGTGAGGQGMMGGAGAGVILSSGESQSGLGDITLTGAYNLVLDGDGSPNFAVTGYLKFPTADENKGLGTGAFDWGPGLSLSKRLGDWQPFSEARYVLQGGSSREEFGARNYFLADVGLGYAWSENLSNSLFCRLGSSAFAGLAAPLEMRLKTVWGFRENTSVEFYLLKGLSNGSPDMGAGISFFVAF